MLKILTHDLIVQRCSVALVHVRTFVRKYDVVEVLNQRHIPPRHKHSLYNYRNVFSEWICSSVCLSLFIQWIRLPHASKHRITILNWSHDYWLRDLKNVFFHKNAKTATATTTSNCLQVSASYSSSPLWSMSNSKQTSKMWNQVDLWKIIFQLQSFLYFKHAWTYWI